MDQSERQSPSQPLRLIGPFSQIITFKDAPLKGPLTEKDLGLIKDGGLIVDHLGKIKTIGNYQELVRASKSYDLEQITRPMVLMPGFVDAHTHLLFAGSRAADYSRRLEGWSYLQIQAAGGGIMDTVKATRAATKNSLKAQLTKRLIKLRRSGVTTVEVKSGYGLTLKEELRLLEIMRSTKKAAAAEDLIDLIPTCLAAHMRDPAYGADNKAYLKDVIDNLLPQLQEKNLTNRIDIFIEKSAFSIEEATYYLQEAKQMGFQTTVHADQFTSGGAALGVQMGAISVDHLEASKREDIQLIASSSSVATVLPAASLGLGLPFAPARKLLDGGAALAIASDWNPGSAPMGHLLTSAALLGVYEKLTMAETLAAITYRAAAALGLEDRGRLQPGSLCDMQAYSTTDYKDILYHQGQLMPAIIWKKAKRNQP